MTREDSSGSTVGSDLHRVSLVRYQTTRLFGSWWRFICRNLKEVQRLETGLLKRKFGTFFRFHLKGFIELIALFPLALIASLVIRLLRPLIRIRLTSLNASRVGHLSLDPELAESERECGIGTDGKRVFDVWYLWTGPFPISNEFLLRMWKRSLHVGPRALCHKIDLVSRVLPGGRAHIVPIRKGIEGVLDHQAGDIHGCLVKTQPHIWFTRSESLDCWRALEVVGVTPESKIVCLLVRDSSYLRTLNVGGFEEHNFRNSDINSYVQMIEALCDNGYVVFRMGAVRAEPLSISRHGFVDYSANGMRSESLDVFLSANCKFFVTTSTGLDGVARVFRRPHVKTNLTQLAGMQLSMPGLVISKRFHCEVEGRLIGLSEVFERGLHRVKSEEELTVAKVRLESNTPKEICEVATEMVERLEGRWVPKDDEEALNRLLLMQIPEYIKAGPRLGRMGYHFMSNNSWLFE